MIDGDMQSFPLTLNKFLEHAAKWHPKTEVVTANNNGASHRIGYADLMERSHRVSAVLRDLGVQQGDRVATLAWNTQAHVEAWYGVMSMGAVCHTLNPRLAGSQLAAMLKQSQARVLIVSADLAPLARQISDGGALLDRVLVIDGEAGAGAERLEP
jgi:acyl-CoA synthetase (AMP-forming)/AMP-acid ligase II